MSEVENIEIPEEPVADLLETVKKFLGTLVPPANVQIEDVLGNSYDLTCAISARNQIKILRQFDSISEMEGVNFEAPDGTISGMVSMISDLAQNESILLVICKCFNMGHPKALEGAKTAATTAGYEYEEGDFASADLFSLEELATAIIPLFIRLAKRTSQAVTKLLEK